MEHDIKSRSNLQPALGDRSYSFAKLKSVLALIEILISGYLMTSLEPKLNEPTFKAIADA